MNKKIVTAAVSLLAAMSVCAGTQYDPGNWNDRNASTSSVKINGDRFFVNNSLLGSNSLLVLSNSLDPSLSLTMILTRNGVSTAYDLTSQLADLKQSGSNLLYTGVTFKRNDIIQFMSSGVSYQPDSVGRWNHPKFNPSYGWKHYFEMTYPSYGGKLDFIFVRACVPPPSQNPTGQPLPGAALTLLAGAGLTCLIRKRRQKKAAPAAG